MDETNLPTPGEAEGERSPIHSGPGQPGDDTGSRGIGRWDLRNLAHDRGAAADDTGLPTPGSAEGDRETVEADLQDSQQS
ncbi:MAG TPA: hypothetical protein VM536_04970 [Chloroflexia bacterium]|nr:hypothetical protein [Chloroflexia bacterium]